MLDHTHLHTWTSFCSQSLTRLWNYHSNKNLPETAKVTVTTCWLHTHTLTRYQQLINAVTCLSLSPPVRSSRAESKCSQRQQKALSSMVHRLSENVKQLQQENGALREELNTDSPAGGIKGLSSLTRKHTDMPVPEPHTHFIYSFYQFLLSLLLLCF